MKLSLPPSVLADALRGFISQRGDDEVAFNAFAYSLFAYQWEKNAPYRAFCDGRGMTPEDYRDWRDVPPAPAAAFKMFALTCAEEADCSPERGGRIFHSSGTTGQETSRHFLDAAALSVYCASLRDSYSRFVLPDGIAPEIFALTHSPEEMPHSSLSFMLGELIADYGGAFFTGGNWQAALMGRLRERETPLVLFGTAFALVHFFDYADERFTLPPGSRIVETGGFKGKSREVGREELYALFTKRFGVPATHCLSEYGMSEMASQFYDSTLYDFVNGIAREPRKIAPPTVRTRILDPVTNEDAAPGQPGLLIHYDIANLNSVLAIQTEDEGVKAEDGDGFRLLGRASGAVLRGCSLTAEEMQSAVSRPLETETGRNADKSETPHRHQR